MAKITRELHRTAKGPVANYEDWWRLVFDTETENLYVEHEWAHLDVRKRNDGENGSCKIDIASALSGHIPDQGRDKLISLITGVFGKEYLALIK
ncbi:hypothetical protein GGE65_008449 [Skermanella aerolata]|uniref:hypothetical protein n=1 Tax=Skermanella aerolata TaxID=393310 RepID=UPI003D1CE1D6